mmetsp:Transcript_105242/g.297842  ORF Transcript_105242/g.297842 Transcript_105242/m.297842 type:complete len:255 (-) Transcript_105242:302-1066(-)
MSTDAFGWASSHPRSALNTWRLFPTTTGKFSSLICAAKASVSLATWLMNCIVFASICPSVALLRCLMANFHVFTARAMSGQVSLLPASHTVRRSAALRARAAGCRSGGVQLLGAAQKPSECSRPASDFLKKHFVAPSCSPKDQCVHSLVSAHTRAQMPLSAALNLSVFLQSFCQQPIEPCSLRSAKIACAPAWRSTTFCWMHAGYSCGATLPAELVHGQASWQTLTCQSPGSPLSSELESATLLAVWNLLLSGT